MSILNEVMRAEMTQHHSLVSQVHRQNKAWIEGMSVVFLTFCFKDNLKQSNCHLRRSAGGGWRGRRKASLTGNRTRAAVVRAPNPNH